MPALAPNESSLLMPALCQVNWTEISEGNLSNFSVMISHGELDACHFEVNATEDHIVLSGFAGLSLVVLETQTTETSWVFPLSIYLPREIHAFYGVVTKAQVVMGDVVVYAPGFDSALLLYESGAFRAPKSSTIYMAQEQAFAELTLGSRLDLEVEAVWLALSNDPAEPSVHNLTDSLQLISSQPGLARFSVDLKALGDLNQSPPCAAGASAPSTRPRKREDHGEGAGGLAAIS
ncbi:ODA11 [Symbiodinium sp. CCMP2592]|nr:ODA11 [Symbiodinium sp. CCMP2592]